MSSYKAFLVRDGVGARGAWGVLGLVWFLLEHITSQDSNRLRRSFSPLRGSIASLTTIPWERLLSLRGGGVLGGFGQRRPVVGGHVEE
jgi:hypothetical protein